MPLFGDQHTVLITVWVGALVAVWLLGLVPGRVGTWLKGICQGIQAPEQTPAAIEGSSGTAVPGGCCVLGLQGQGGAGREELEGAE